jgi:superfamily II DNA or RNA helicase
MRYYQKEADEEIYSQLKIQDLNKCVVKLFCGTGKSKIMAESKINHDANMIAFAFPSLQLVEQFDSDYLDGIPTDNKIRICSDDDEISTTNVDFISQTIKKKQKKSCLYILVTYQSLSTLLDVLHITNVQIDATHFDEAHHCTAHTYKSLIFSRHNSKMFGKCVFYTATPKNRNGVTMIQHNDENDEELEIEDFYSYSNSECWSDSDDYSQSSNSQSNDSDSDSDSDSKFNETRVVLNNASKKSQQYSCGPIVKEYGYYQGMLEGYLNAFDINIDLYSQNTNESVYESIARAVLQTGNSRVLTFHADVNSGRDSSVTQFVDELKFQNAFDKVFAEEFADKNTRFTKNAKTRMIALHAGVLPKCNVCKSKCRNGIRQFVPTDDICCRFNVLKSMDALPDDNSIMIISSCQTIGEGVDTKTANMIVFVDPKASMISITQNIGRIVRKICGNLSRKSTILLPCWVDQDLYVDANTAEERDDVIRKNLGKGGNFNSILNVMSALKQDNKEMHDLCLYYPNSFTKSEIKGSLHKQNYKLDQKVGDGSAAETIAYKLGRDIGYKSNDLQQIATNENVEIEVHTNSLDKPIYTILPKNKEKSNTEQPTVKARIFQEKVHIMENEETESIYYPIVPIESTKADNNKPLNKPNAKLRMQYNCNTNKDTQVLWKLADNEDFSKTLGSCTIDCEIISNIEKWKQSLFEYKQIIDNTGKRPSKTDKNKEIKTLGTWGSHQQTNYHSDITKCKNIMKTVEIHTLWTNFIDQYSSIMGPPLKKKEKSEENEKCNIKKNIKKIKPKTKTETKLKLKSKLTEEKAYNKLEEIIEEKIEPKPFVYDELTSQEQQEFAALFQKMQREKIENTNLKQGYQSTNLDDKDRINQWFVDAIPEDKDLNTGKIIVLDHTEFKSTRAVLSKLGNVCKSNLIVPQYDEEIYETMFVDKEYGSCVRFASLETVLEECISNKTLVRGIYSDLTYALPKTRGIIELVKQLNFMHGAPVGVTVSMRNPEGVDYTNQDSCELCAEMYSAFSVECNVVKENCSSSVYVYGKCTRMATAIIKVGVHPNPF